MTSRSRASTVNVGSSVEGSLASTQAQTTIAPLMSTPPASELGQELVRTHTNVQLDDINATGHFKPYQ
jgi:hypothetical protein